MKFTEPETDFDYVLLMERADAGAKLLYDNRENVDPYEVLAAVVWPSPEAIDAQLEARAERGLSTS